MRFTASRRSTTGRGLILELVEGPTLAERLSIVALQVGDALAIAQQIAEALEAAHAKRIIHRDLKPANIKITPTGVVKVLDFGLARDLADEREDVAASQSPTVTWSGTRDGAILGTVAYMSPEQARGEPVDNRADIWAFGCVLFEMLTAKRPFAGETSSETIAAILKREPDWRALPPATPTGIGRLLRRTLEKDHDRRLDDIGSVRAELEKALERRPVLTRRSIVSGAVLTTVLAAAGVLLYRAGPQRPVTSPAEYTQITNFTDAAMAPSLSPDGRMVTFKRGTNTGQAGAVEDFLGAGQVYVKQLPAGEAVQLTDGPGSKYAPVFTPDAARVAYTQLSAAGTSLSWDTWTVPALGGQPTRMLPNASGLTWIGRQEVLFSEISSGLHMGIVTATETRANSRLIYSPALDLGMAHYSYLSPDRRSVLVVEMANTHAFDSPCRLVPFDGTSAGRQVGPPGTCLSTGWSPDGKWMYFAADVRGGVHLWRQRFPDGTPEQITFGANQEQGIAVDPDGRSLVTSMGQRLSAIWVHDSGGDRPITAEGYASAAHLSAEGARAYYVDSATSAAFSPAGPAPAGELRVVQLASGKVETVLPGIAVSGFDLSADGEELLYATLDKAGESEIWLAPLDRRASPRRLARSADQPSFGRNGDVFFRAKENQQNFLYRMNTDGTARARVTDRPVLIAFSASPDGEWVAGVVAENGVHSDGGDPTKVPMATVAIPVHGGPLRRICGATCPSQWSRDGRFFYVLHAGGTRVMPVADGTMLPDLPASGLAVDTRPDVPRGTRIIPRKGVFLASDPTVYLYQRTELHANLFRIPLH